MTRQQLRVVIGEWFCGCGDPALAAERLRDILALHPLYDNRAAFERLVPDEGIQYLLLYMLDSLDLAEHGGNVGGAWLTPLGQDVLDALNAEAASDFQSMMESWCAHGFDLSDDTHVCVT